MPNEEFPRPRIVLSRCIDHDPVRYNGQMIPDDFVRGLRPYVDFVLVCPEVAIGLGVPRDTLRLVEVAGDVRMLQPATGRDVTEEMRAFVKGFLDDVGDVDGFILKSGSPSSGYRDVKVYRTIDGPAKLTGKAGGMFGGEVTRRFGHLAVEDEGRLRNMNIREHWLTKAYTIARFREMGEGGSMKDLVRFQAEHKFLLMAYNQKELREMGRVVANHEKRPLDAVLGDYWEHLCSALAKAPRYTSNINVLMHSMGYFKGSLSGEEKAHFLDVLEDYREGNVPLVVPQSLLRSWALRFGEDYILSQRFFEPFPADLMRGSKKGRGRDYWS
jgi:uncharacterized protein YbgA (DUF1722 family)/uncharacterized protein YbbK (DUF523 family)